MQYQPGASNPTSYTKDQFLRQQGINPDANGATDESFVNLKQYNQADIGTYINHGGALGAAQQSAAMNTQKNTLATPQQFAAATAAQNQQLAGDQGMNVKTQLDANGNIVAETKVPLAQPPISQIGNPMSPPSASGGSPSFQQPQGTTTVANYTTSMAASIQSQQQQLQDAYKQQEQQYQSKVDALTKQQQDLQQLQDNGMISEHSTIMQETADKQAAYDQEKRQFQENYQANQALVNEMDGLLTQGNQIVEQMQNTTGLSSIMQPRIAKTMSDVAARTGVIQAVLSARNGQIGQAQNQLRTSLDAISSIAGDQINYYKSVIDFYQQQKSDNASQIASLMKDTKSYADAQISLLESNLQQTQQTAQLIQKAMLNPDTAIAYAKAGVTLNDTVEQINQKLATYEEAQQLQWGAPHIVGGSYVQTNKITGETRTVSSANVSGGGSSVGGTSGGTNGLSGDSANFFAQVASSGVNMNSLLPSLGMGSSATATKTAIMNDIAKNAQALGIDGGTFAAMLTDSRAKTAAYTQLQKIGSQTEVNADNANKDFAQVIQLSQKIDATTLRLATPVFEKWLQTGQLALTGNADVNNFVAVLTTSLTEYAKVVSGQNGGAAVTVEANKQAQALLNSGMSTASIQSFAQAAKQEMGNRTTSYNSALKGLFGDIQSISDTSGGLGGGSSGKGSMTDSQFVASAVKSTGADYNSVISGAPKGQIAVVENSSGQIGYIPVGEFNASQYTKM